MGMDGSHFHTVSYLMLTNLGMLLLAVGLMSWYWFLWRNRRFYRLLILSIVLTTMAWTGLQ